MCGICGWLELGNKMDYMVLESMNNIAKHRGPDDEGYVVIGDKIIPKRGNDTCEMAEKVDKLAEYRDAAFLAFGHRRLSIIDLTPAGHQPMIHKDGNLCVTFNGEIYNYIELKKELKLLGHEFFTDSDTEVLLQAYAEWGEECVNHLNGMWAFAIWDAKNNTLFCSRDRLGAKPFYYYRDGDRFIFSSEIKQLCQNPLIPRKLNDEIMTAQIMYGLTDFSEQTLIKDIFSLPGGYNLRIVLNDARDSLREFSVKKYWDVVFHEKCGVEQTKTFEILKNAVQIRTRSDVSVGALLSGGLDSSILVAEISEYYKELGKDCSELNTYTSCYEGFEEGDDREFAEQVNQYCGTTQNFIYPDPKDTYSDFEKMVWHMEGSCSLSGLGGFLTLKEIASRGEKVLINGQGSDETMFGYERYYAFYLRDIHRNKGIRKFLKECKTTIKNSKLSMSLLLKYYIYFNVSLVRKIRCYTRMRKYVMMPVRKSFKKNNSINRFLKFSSLKDLQYNEIRNTQLTHILRMDDRSYMAFSLESRVPYIDYRYIEEVIKINEGDKIKEGYTKYLLRNYIDGHLPDTVVWRKNKMGWPSPRERWVSRFDKEKVNDLFDNARSGKYFNIPQLKKLYQKAPVSWPIEQFMIIEMFVRLFNVEV